MADMDTTEVPNGYVRSLEDVVTVIGHAKLDAGDLRPLTQVLYVAQSMPDYRLLELTPEIAQALKDDNELVFRGQRSDRAVMCTSNATFEVKEAETSNSLLLTPELKFPSDIPIAADGGGRSLERKEILGVSYTYLELRQIVPLLGRLRLLLVPYAGPEQERRCGDGDDDSGPVFHTTESMLESGAVQMSRAELEAALQELEALQIDGYWRVLEFDYHWRALSFLLNLIDENSWSLDKIPIGETLTCLGELLPRDVVHHVLKTYLELTGDFTDEALLKMAYSQKMFGTLNPQQDMAYSGEELYSLARLKVSRLCAQVLLRAANKFNLNDFLNAWQQSVPQAITVNLSHLEGVALYDKEVRPPVVWYCPEDSFSEDVQERFNALFKIKHKWTLDQITPYISPFQGHNYYKITIFSDDVEVTSHFTTAQILPYAVGNRETDSDRSPDQVCQVFKRQLDQVLQFKIQQVDDAKYLFELRT